MCDQLPEPVAKAHAQAQFLIELLLKNDHDEVKRVFQSLPVEDVMPLLGSALIYGAETMKSHFGTKGALEHIAAARQQIGERGGLHE